MTRSTSSSATSTVSGWLARLFDNQLTVIVAVSVGGGIGAGLRYAAGLSWPAAPTAFPWTTLLINVVGSALIGVLIVMVEVLRIHRLARPFLGTGVLGGFTTFSAFAADVERLVAGGAARTALAYFVATPVLVMTSVWLASGGTRRMVRRRRT